MFRRIGNLVVDLNPVLCSLALFLFLMSGNVLTLRNAEFLNTKLISSQVENASHQIIDQIENQITERHNDLELLAALWPNYQPHLQVANFLRDATKIATQKPLIHAINFIDTTGVVIISAPEGRRPDLIGLNVSKLPERKELHEKVRRETVPLASPPLRFNDGRDGMVIWHPVSTTSSGEKKTTGIIAGTFDVRDFIQHAISSVNKTDYGVQIRINGKIYYSDLPPNKGKCIPGTSSRILGVNWEIDAYPAQESHFVNLRKGSLWLFITGTLFSAMAAFLFSIVLISMKRIKKNQIALRASEENYRQLFQINPHPMLVFNLNTLRIIAVNNTAVSVYGYSREEFLNMTIRELRPPEDIPMMESIIADISEGMHKTGVVRHCKKNGEIFHVEIVSHSLQIEGNHQEQIVLINDVTERLKAEEALKRNEESLSITLNSIGDAVIAADHRAQIIRMNPAAEKMTGWSSQEASGKCLWQICRITKKGSDDNLLPFIFSIKDFNSSVDPLILIGKTGKELLISCNSTPIISREGESEGIVLVLQDITERSHLEEQLRQSQKLELIGQLAGGIAHDFNNILLPIVAYADFVLQKLGEDHPEAENLKEIISAADRAKNLVNQLLAFSRKQLLQTSIVNVNNILKNISGMLRRLIGENINIEMKLSPGIGNIRADVSQIEQILLNIAVNARDAMSDGGTLTFDTSEVELRLKSTSLSPELFNGNYIVVKVTDTGTGMDEKTKSRVFEPFFTTKKKGKGTGLGMATAYGILKQHGGTIQVETEPGKGTSFIIYIPRCFEAETPVLSSHKHSRTDAALCNASILLVEDELIVRSPISRFLTSKGLRVTEAENGKMALDMVVKNAGKFDLLITDLIMPEMNGKELYEKISSMIPGIRVIYMSGYPDDILVDKGVLDNNVNFLHKPFSMELLWNTIQHALKDQKLTEGRFL